jgi:hypothetical protein
MKILLPIAVAFAWPALAVAQLPAGRAAPTQSSSGQFLVFAPPTLSLPTRFAAVSANTNYVVLEPTLLAVSCERIKQKLLLTLGSTAPWKGRIYLNLHTARSADETVTIVSEKFADGWNYRVDLPNLLQRERFVRAIVQVLLFELVDRNNPSPRSAEIPLWLVEGLARELRASSEVDLILSPPRWTVRGVAINPQSVESRWSNPLKTARGELDDRPPLTFQQLSWPEDGQLTGKDAGVYSGSAQLLVRRLLQFDDGQTCLRAMLDRLPHYYNWQLAFLKAFHTHFQSTLDVEKWWALQVVQFTGRDLTQTWTLAESRKELDGILRPRLDVRTAKDELPLEAEATVQTVIQTLPPAGQLQVLRRTLYELDLLRLCTAPELAPLVDDYRHTLRAYLQRQGLIEPVAPPQTRTRRDAGTLKETIAELNALDTRRATPPAEGVSPYY